MEPGGSYRPGAPCPDGGDGVITEAPAAWEERTLPFLGWFQECAGEYACSTSDSDCVVDGVLDGWVTLCHNDYENDDYDNLNGTPTNVEVCDGGTCVYTLFCPAGNVITDVREGTCGGASTGTSTEYTASLEACDESCDWGFVFHQDESLDDLTPELGGDDGGSSVNRADKNCGNRAPGEWNSTLSSPRSWHGLGVGCVDNQSAQDVYIWWTNLTAPLVLPSGANTCVEAPHQDVDSVRDGDGQWYKIRGHSPVVDAGGMIVDVTGNTRCAVPACDADCP